MAPRDETVSSAYRRLVAAGIDLTQLRTIVVDTANRDESAIRLIALFGTLRQGDLTVLFGVSKVTTSRLVARLIATEQLRASVCPDGTRGRPATWLLLPGSALPSGAERRVIATLVSDAAIALQAAGRDIQLPKHTTAASVEDTSWPATARQKWLERGTVLRPLPPWEASTADIRPQPAPFAHHLTSGRTPALPPWQRPSSRTHGYGWSITRRIWPCHSLPRKGNRWTVLGHQVKAAISCTLLHLRSIGRGIWHGLRCIEHAIWSTVRCLGAMIGWMSQCIAVLHELTDRRIWPTMLMIALPIAGYMMFSLVHSVNVMPAMEVAPISAPPPTQVPTPTAGFGWARVVGTGGVGLLIRNVPNGKRRLGMDCGKGRPSWSLPRQ